MLHISIHTDTPKGVVAALIPNAVYLHTLLPLGRTSLVAPDVGPINSSLQILSVDVSGESVAVTLAFDVRYVVLLMCSRREIRHVAHFHCEPLLASQFCHL